MVDYAHGVVDFVKVDIHMTEDIEQLKEELTHCNYDFDNYKRCSDKLVDALELKIKHMQDRLKEVTNKYHELKDMDVFVYGPLGEK